MIRQDTEIKVERSGDFNESSFGIDTEDVSLILEIIRNKLYTNKMGSFIREITSNAYDAMIEAAINNGESPESVQKKQIHIILPNDDNHSTLTIRDFGTGMTDDKVKKIYTRVGKSTRSGSNNYVGMMGIGRLVGFCLTDSFNVASYVDGIKTEYVCYIDETKCGKVAMLSQSETNDPNGIGISVNVPEEQYHELKEEVSQFTAFIKEVGFRFFNTDNEYHFRGIDHTKDSETSFQGTDWVKYTSRVGKSAYVKMGLVKYPLPDEVASGNFFENGTVIFNVNIGDVAVGASREGLEFTPKTKAHVEMLIKRAKEEAAKEMMKDILTATDLKIALRMFLKHSSVWESLDEPEVKWLNPETNRELILNDINHHPYETTTFRYVTKDELDANGKPIPLPNGGHAQVNELDVNGKPIVYEIKHNSDRIEARCYKVDGSRRNKIDKALYIQLDQEHYSSRYYYRLVDDHDIESLPDIRRCRTLMTDISGYGCNVFVFTHRGLEHFIHMYGWDPTKFMKKFEDVVETILPRGQASRPPVQIRKVVFTYDPFTNKVEAKSDNATDSLDNLTPGYWVSRHYSSILYNRGEMRAIDDNELDLLFRSICGFLKHPITLYILPANCGRILDNMRAAGDDEYADLVPVYMWVDNLFKSTTILDFLCSSTTDLHADSWHVSRIADIFKANYALKSPVTIEIVDLIKKAIRPLVPGETKVPAAVINKLRECHNNAQVSVRNFSQILQTKMKATHSQYPLLLDSLTDVSDIEKFIKKVMIYDEYIHAIDYQRSLLPASAQIITAPDEDEDD